MARQARHSTRPFSLLVLQSATSVSSHLDDGDGGGDGEGGVGGDGGDGDEGHKIPPPDAHCNRQRAKQLHAPSHMLCIASRFL